jgi:iron complex transport system substrate-binding protein
MKLCTVVFFPLFFACILVFAIVPPQLRERISEHNIPDLCDMYGNHVYLSGPVTNGFILPPVTGQYLTVDMTDRNLGGIPLYYQQESSSTLLGCIFPGLENKPGIITAAGARPLGVEPVLEHNFDMLMTYASFSEPYINIGYPALVQIESLNRREIELIELMGQLTGKPGRANYLTDRYKLKIAELFRTVPAKQPLITLLFVSHDYFMLWPQLPSRFDIYLARLGAVNLAAGSPKNSGPNIESLFRLDPDFIFLYDYGNDLTVQDVYGNPALSGLKALKNRKVYRMPKGAMRMLGPVEEPLLFAWLGQILHYGNMPFTSLREEIKNTFKDIYSFDISETEIDKMLHIKENSPSFGYEQFLQN